MHYNGFRHYSPTIGRYMSSDPIGLAGGMNTYGYAAGNPLMYYDPLGLVCISDFAADLISAFVAGFASGFVGGLVAPVPGSALFAGVVKGAIAVATSFASQKGGRSGGIAADQATSGVSSSGYNAPSPGGRARSVAGAIAGQLGSDVADGNVAGELATTAVAAAISGSNVLDSLATSVVDATVNKALKALSDCEEECPP